MVVAKPHYDIIITLYVMIKNLKNVILLLLIFETVGCKTIQVVDNVFIPEHGLYRVPLPEGNWDIVMVSEEDIAMRNNLSMAMLTIILNPVAHIDMPLEVLLNHILIGIHNKMVLAKNETLIDGEMAINAILRAEMDGKVIKMDVFVVRRGGKAFNILYWAHPDHYDKTIHDFEAMVKGFTFVRE